MPTITKGRKATSAEKKRASLSATRVVSGESVTVKSTGQTLTAGGEGLKSASDIQAETSGRSGGSRSSSSSPTTSTSPTTTQTKIVTQQVQAGPTRTTTPISSTRQAILPTTSAGLINLTALQEKEAQKRIQPGPTRFRAEEIKKKQLRQKTKEEFTKKDRQSLKKLRQKNPIAGTVATVIAEAGGRQLAFAIKNPSAKSQARVKSVKKVFKDSPADKLRKFIFEPDTLETKQREQFITGKGQFLSATKTIKGATSKFQRAETKIAESKPVKFLAKQLTPSEEYFKGPKGKENIGAAILTGAVKQATEKPLSTSLKVGAGVVTGGAAGFLFKGASAVKGAGAITKIATGAFIGVEGGKAAFKGVTEGKVAAFQQIGRSTTDFLAFTGGSTLGFKGAVGLKRAAGTTDLVGGGKIVRRKGQTTFTKGAAEGKVKGIRIQARTASKGRTEFTRGFAGKKGEFEFRSTTRKGVTRTKIFRGKQKVDEFFSLSKKPVRVRGEKTLSIGKNKFFKTLKGTRKTKGLIRTTAETKRVDITFSKKPRTAEGIFKFSKTQSTEFAGLKRIAKQSKKLIPRGKKASQAIGLPESLRPGTGVDLRPQTTFTSTSPIRPQISSDLTNLAPTKTFQTFKAQRFFNTGRFTTLNQVSSRVIGIQTPKLNLPISTISRDFVGVESNARSFLDARSRPTTEAQTLLESTAKPAVETLPQSLGQTRSGSASRTRPIIESSPGITPRIRTPTIRVPDIPLPITPFVPVAPGLPFGGDASRRSFFRRVKPKKSARKVTPTLFAAGFGIRGKVTKGGIKSGLGIRPLKLKGKKKKKKKNRGLIAI